MPSQTLENRAVVNFHHEHARQCDLPVYACLKPLTLISAAEKPETGLSAAMTIPLTLDAWAHDLASDFNPFLATGSVLEVSAGCIEIDDRLALLDIGARIEIETTSGILDAEIVGLTQGAARALPFGGLEGVRRGAAVKFSGGKRTVRPSKAWLGRIVDALGRPIDGKGPLPEGGEARALQSLPPPAPLRARLGEQIDFGVRTLNAFTPARAGQRLGVFAGAGLGKSALLSMIARNTDCDVAVIGLIGERGREVREFVEDQLGEEGLARAVVIVATSDQPALMRREAALLAVTLAEYFRDRAAPEAHVLCLIDSLTRIAAAQREIGLAAGEPPALRGFTPSVFALLPQILERIGPGAQAERAGRSTGVFSVLVEGDDHDEPIADCVRAILDGHIVLDRAIAERGRFPAIDVSRSLSRVGDGLLSDGQQALVKEARRHTALYEDMREMIRIGAYQRGSDPATDEAIVFNEHFEKFLTQSRQTCASINDTFEALQQSFAAASLS